MLFSQEHPSPSKQLTESFVPNSTGFPALPLTIGRICGWFMLTILSSILFDSFSCIHLWLRQELGWKEQQKKLSLEEIVFFANFASETAQNSGVSKAVAESIKLDSVRQFAPEAEPLLMLHKKAIASANPLSEKALSPTELGVILAKKLGLAKVSARAVNKKLLELQYQISVKRVRKSTGKTVHDYYKATEKGEEYSQLEMATYQVKEGNSTKYQLRWKSRIIDILANNWFN